MSKFEAIYMGKKKEIEADDLWDAKNIAIVLFKIPKSKQGLLAIQSLKSKEAEDFRLN